MQKNAKNCQIAIMQKIAKKIAIFHKIAKNRGRDFPEWQVASICPFNQLTTITKCMDYGVFYKHECGCFHTLITKGYHNI